LTGRVLGTILMVCAGLSGLVLWVVQSNLSNTQATVINDTPAAMNFLVQSSHSFDQFIDAVRELQLHTEDSPIKRSDAEKLLRKRYDVLWGSFSIFTAQFPVVETTTLAIAEEFSRKAQRFFDETQPAVDSKKSLNPDDLNALIVSSRMMLHEIHNLARNYYLEATARQDVASSHIETLSGYMRLFITLIMLTGGLGAGILFRSNTRTNALFNEDTVEELRSGRREQEAKDSFIVSASHDLRQPLHALGLFLNSLTHDVRPAGQKALRQAIECLDGLNLLFNSLLDLSKLDAGDVTIDVESFALHDLLTNIHTQVHPIAQAKGISLILALNNKKAYAKTDRLLLGRIVCNLVENAIEHSGATQVSISLNPDRNGHGICVIDNGKGIAKNEHTAIFSVYYQLENPERDRSKGLGLGLSIVKRLSQILDIDVKMDSTQGAGTSFTMVVPVGSPTPVLPPATNAHKTIRLENLTGAVIVVIDDDNSIQEAMSMMLANLGLLSVCAETVDWALDELAERNLEPDLILADYRLRDHVTGDNAIKQMREAIDADIPGMIITGDTSPERVSELNATGFDILYKPVDAKTLHQKIGEMLVEPAQLSLRGKAYVVKPA